MDTQTNEPTGVPGSTPSEAQRRGARALSNLLWLLPDVPRRRVLVVHDGASPFIGVLDPHFEVCESLRLDSRAGERVPDLGTDRPDLVVVDVDAVRRCAGLSLSAWIRSLDAQALHGGPPVALHFKARGRRFTASAVSRVARDVVHGARRVHSAYYAAPSLTRPIEFVPIDRGAVHIFDALSARSMVRRAARRLLIQLGLHDLLFDDVVLVAVS